MKLGDKRTIPSRCPVCNKNVKEVYYVKYSIGNNVWACKPCCIKHGIPV